MEACRSAIDLGFNHIELDTRCTADGVLIAYHSPTLGTWGRYTDVSLLTWDEVQHIRKDGYAISKVRDILTEAPYSYILHLKRENNLDPLYSEFLRLPYPVRVHSNSEPLLEGMRSNPNVSYLFKSIYTKQDYIIDWVDGYMIGHRAGFHIEPIANEWLQTLADAGKILWTFAGNTERWLQEVKETPTVGVLTSRIDRFREIYG
jgi:glycerophosphoryl diester phosphodiesterase